MLTSYPIYSAARSFELETVIFAEKEIAACLGRTEAKREGEGAGWYVEQSALLLHHVGLFAFLPLLTYFQKLTLHPLILNLILTS